MTKPWELNWAEPERPLPGLSQEQSDALRRADAEGRPFPVTVDQGVMSDNIVDGRPMAERKKPWELEWETPAEPAPPKKATDMDRVKDTGVELAKGVVSLGESGVGLGDIATFGLIGKGLEKLGYGPKQTQAFLSGLQPCGSTGGPPATEQAPRNRGLPNRSFRPC